MRLMFVIAAIVFVLDQISKLVVVHWLDLKSIYSIDFLPPVLNFRMGWNRGINFGLLADDGALTRWILILVALLITGWVIWWMKRETRMPARIAAGMLIGGAIGNVLDRLIYGAVADFMNSSCCGFENPYTYNIADIGIFAGAVGLILFTGERKMT